MTKYARPVIGETRYLWMGGGRAYDGWQFIVRGFSGSDGCMCSDLSPTPPFVIFQMKHLLRPEEFELVYRRWINGGGKRRSKRSFTYNDTERPHPYERSFAYLTEKEKAHIV